MLDKYDLIDEFPSLYSKYELSLIIETLDGTRVNPCETLYDKVDLRSNTSGEDMIENLAFNNPESMQKFLDAKNYMFNSRRVDAQRLARYLEKTYNYDTPKIREFDDDKKSLFLILFHETYNDEINEVNDEFTEARTDAYKFKDRRDRMTRLDANVNLNDVVEKIPKFADSKSNEVLTNATHYLNGSRERLVVLIRQESGRELVSRFEQRHNSTSNENKNREIVYTEDYPIRETAVQIVNDDDGCEIKVYSSVSTWEDTLMKFFITTMNQDVTEPLARRESVTAKKIVENVKDYTTEEVDSVTAGAQVEDIVANGVQSAADDLEDEDTQMNTDTVQNMLDDLMVTGIHIDGEETTFEIHSSDGIRRMIQEYEGIASSLAQSVSDADVDDITVYAVVPNASSEDDEFVLEKGEWYMDSGGSARTMKALEAVLK
jgi:hypothetical protein